MYRYDLSSVLFSRTANFYLTLFCTFVFLIFFHSIINTAIVNAATFNPTTSQELRAAIGNSNPTESNTINLVPGMTYTITGLEGGGLFTDGHNGDNGLPIIISTSGNSLTINGNGATIERDPALFTDPNDPCSGAGAKFRLFQINATATGATLIINDLGIRNGCEVNMNDGGAIYNPPSGMLTINNCVIMNNKSLGNGGGIINSGSLEIINSTISNNTALHGGGVRNEGFATITNSTISDNIISSLGGGLSNSGIITITNSTFSDNIGGGLQVEGLKIPVFWISLMLLYQGTLLVA